MFIMEMPWKELWKKQCSKFRPETLVAYLEGKLKGRQADETKAHLAECNACQSFAEDYRAFMTDTPTRQEQAPKKLQNG